MDMDERRCEFAEWKDWLSGDVIDSLLFLNLAG